MKKAAIILAQGFEEIEALTPADYLRRAGIEVVIVSVSSSDAYGLFSVCGSHGITVLADTGCAEYLQVIETGGAAALPDVIIIPGGMPGASNVAASREVCSLITSLWQSNRIVAALCAAPVVVLAGRGILRGRHYTCYGDMDADFEKWAGSDWKNLTHGAIHEQAALVRDGNLVTANAPGAAEEFSIELISMLAGEVVANSVCRGSFLRTHAAAADSGKDCLSVKSDSLIRRVVIG